MNAINHFSVTRNMLAASAALCLVLSGCSSSGSGSGTSSTPASSTPAAGAPTSAAPGGGKGGAGKKIVMVQAATSIPYTQQEVEGAKDGAAAAGVSISFTGPSINNPEQQISQLQQAVAGKPDGILIQEIPPSVFVRPVQLAEQAGVPVLPFQVPPAANSSSKSFVGNNDKQLGGQAGDAVADAIISSKGKGATGVVLTGTCLPGLSVLDARVAGFTAAIHNKLPSVKVLAPFKSAQDPTASYGIWKPALAAQSNVVAAYSPCEPDTEALVKIKTESNAAWILAGHDIDTITLTAVQKGQIVGLYPISPYEHGYLAAYILGKSLTDGKAVPAGFIAEDTVPITQATYATAGQSQLTAEGRKAFWKPYIDKILAKPNYGAKPLTEASQ